MSTVRITTREVIDNDWCNTHLNRRTTVTSMTNPWSDSERTTMLSALAVPYFNHYKLEVWDAAEQAFELVMADYY